MKAITLWQPWASLVVIGAKRIETRGWQPHGLRPGELLAIHASKRFPQDGYRLCFQWPFRQALAVGGYLGPKDLALGAIVGFCRYERARYIWPSQPRWLPEEPERSFGDYRPGRWMWMLRSPHRLAKPIPAKGRLGVWEWEPPAALLEELGL